MARKAPAQFSAYLVVASDVAEMPVGATLIDKGNRLIAEWNLMNFDTGEQTSAIGERLSRLCVTCRIEFKRVGILGHDGDCGTDPVNDEAKQVLRDAAKHIEARR